LLLLSDQTLLDQRLDRESASSSALDLARCCARSALPDWSGAFWILLAFQNDVFKIGRVVSECDVGARLIAVRELARLIRLIYRTRMIRFIIASRGTREESEQRHSNAILCDILYDTNNDTIHKKHYNTRRNTSCRRIETHLHTVTSSLPQRTTARVHP
jgi:hypothetical protein